MISSSKFRANFKSQIRQFRNKEKNMIRMGGRHRKPGQKDLQINKQTKNMVMERHREQKKKSWEVCSMTSGFPVSR
jgi:hypothetical protein